MAISPPSRDVRCRLCGCVLRGLLPIDHKPNGAMLLHHLSWDHPHEVGAYLERMRTEDIGTVAMEAFERVNPPPRKGEHMEASPEVQRALATIQAVIEDLAPEAPLAVDQPSTSEVEEARRALSVLRNFFEVEVEP